MAMSMRERTTEVAVLKAIGFSKQRILALVLGESTVIAVMGGVLGIAGGLLALQLLSSVPIAAAMFPIPVSSLVGPWLVGLVAVAAMNWIRKRRCASNTCRSTVCRRWPPSGRLRNSES